MNAMDRVLTCPDCGHRTNYRPEECELVLRYRPAGKGTEEVRHCLVRCAG
jgi:hypothetical protein